MNEMTIEQHKVLSESLHGLKTSLEILEFAVTSKVGKGTVPAKRLHDAIANLAFAQFALRELVRGGEKTAGSIGLYI